MGGDGSKFTREDRFSRFDLGPYELRLGRNWFASQRVGNHVMTKSNLTHATEIYRNGVGTKRSIAKSCTRAPSVVRCRLLETFGATYRMWVEYMEAYPLDSDKNTGTVRPIPLRTSTCLSMEETGCIGRRV